MKPKSKKNVKPLLSDKIADALTIKPRADIEDDQVFGTKPHTVSRADLSSSESEDDAAISDFRKRNVNLLSEISKKYEGQVVTRKDLDKNTSESEIESDSDGGDDGGFQSKLASIASKFNQEDSDGSDEEQRDSQNGKKSSDSDISSGGESDDYSITQRQKGTESDHSEEDDDDDGEGYDISQMEEPVKEEFEHMKKQNVSEEAKKGASVRNQLLVWEGLLEMRIHLQRCMSTANQMPLPEVHKDLRQNNEFAEACNTATSNIASVLDKFLSLQSMLLKGFPETKALSPKKQATVTVEKKEESDEEIPSDTDNEEIPSDTEEEDNIPVEDKSPKKTSKEQPQKKRKLTDYESELATAHKVFKPFRDATIQKWNEKTRLATATNIKNAPSNTILQQISYILSDRSKLVKRTQLKRSEYDIVGYKKEPNDLENKEANEENPVTKDRKDDDEYITEIFDDSDFYHQLLRELIECKSADISDPVQLSRQWIALQQMRSKMKRKVDTKATKGRKIKYVVHNQLVNYMAPEKCTTWTDESTNELYSSLFGKMFEYNNVGLNANLENGLKIKD
ncbi:protein Aatf [Cydia amplana]|uniref:protein Aatf n=1 Tax=Cydia amplana TaxID=1869771 RepID=UPI002FE54450